MTTEHNDAPLGRRVNDLERAVGALRQRVTELERATGSAASIQPLEMAAMEIAPLDSSPQPPPAPVPAPVITAPVVAMPVELPPPLPVTPPPAFVPQPPSPLPPPISAPRPAPYPSLPSGPEGPSPLRVFLERLQLWPPSGEKNTEASLGTWWATRLGTLLLVIGVVFLGVYASQNAAPWVRFVELLGVSVGISAFGLWLERKIERFGAVLFGGGLALLYFCAFGAYTVAAMKIIESPVVAAGWQLAAVVVMSGAAVWRRSSVVATMAVALGFVTAVFSRGDGLPGFALGSALLLGVAAVVFQRRWRWEAPAFVAMPATYVVGALVLHDAWINGTGPARGWTWLFLVGALGLYFVRDWRATRTTALSVGRAEKAFQGINSSLAAVVGVGAALVMYRAHLAEFYFGAAVVFGGLAFLRLRQVEGDAIGAVLLAKSAGALTLGVIEIVEGRTTAIALLVQAWVMLFAAWRIKSRVLATGTGVVAALACWFFVRDGAVPVPVASLAAAGSVAFVTGLALLATEMARRLLAHESQPNRRALEVLGAVAAGLLALLTADNWLPEDGKPAMLAGLAAILVVAAWLRRALGPALAAVFPLVAANLALWREALGAPGDAVLWWNALAVLAPMTAAGAWVGGLRAGWPLQALSTGFRAVGAGLWAAAVLGLVLVFFNAWTGAWALCGAASMALAIVAFAPRWPERYLVLVATWAAALGVGLWWLDEAGVFPSSALVGAAVFLWLLAISAEAWPQLRAVMQRERGATWWSAVQVAAATIVSLRAILWLSDGHTEPLSLALAALAVGALVLRPGLDRAMEASWVFWAFAWMAFREVDRLDLSLSSRAALVAVGVLAWLPVVAVARSSRIRSEWMNGQRWWRAAEPIQNAFALFIAILVASVGFGGAAEFFVLLAATAFAVGAARLGRSVVPQNAAIALVLFAVPKAYVFVAADRANDWGIGLAAVMAVAATLSALPLVIERMEPKPDRAQRRGIGRFVAAVGGVLAFYAAVSQTGDLAPYVTVGWGLIACALFVAGLVARSRPHRLLGLIGLALCVGRVFVVDLNSTLHRIIAFVVVGVVLLGVGFSYQKFRHLIVDDEPDQPEPAPPPVA